MSPHCSGFPKKEEPRQERKGMAKVILSMMVGVACFLSIALLYA